MEYCSVCKKILKPEFTFCPFCGARKPGHSDVERGFTREEGEVLLPAEPGPGDVVVFRAWDIFEESLKEEDAGSTWDVFGSGLGNLTDDTPEMMFTDHDTGERDKELEKSVWKDIDFFVPGADENEKKGSGDGDIKSRQKSLLQAEGPEEKMDSRFPEKDTEEDTSPERIAEAGPGDMVRLGGIPWHVLWVRADSSLLAADQSLVKMSLTQIGHQVSWKSSRLRKWLNSTFIEEFFTPEQRTHLKMIKNSTSIRREDGYNIIEGTEDIATVLSRQEYQFYVSRSRTGSWGLYSQRGIIRDFASYISGGGAITTLQVENGRENWSEAEPWNQTGVYPVIWWRTR